MPDIIYLVNDLMDCNSIQEFINRRFSDPEKIIVDKRYFDGTVFSEVVSVEGIRFRMHTNTLAALNINEYYSTDIRRDDIVLDIGANIGAFALPVSRRAKSVFAIEPIMWKELECNVTLNHAEDNVIILRTALGDGTPQEVSWTGETITMPTQTLGDIKRQCGGKIDFLKCDCEGFEWQIRPEHLAGIRRIEMELHYFDGLEPNSDLLDYIRSKFDVKISDGICKDVQILHGYRTCLL